MPLCQTLKFSYDFVYIIGSVYNGVWCSSGSIYSTWHVNDSRGFPYHKWSQGKPKYQCRVSGENQIVN